MEDDKSLENEKEVITSAKRTNGNGKLVDPQVILANKESLTLVEHFSNELGGAGDFKVKIIRKSPTIWRGKNIAGHMEQIEGELITEEEIKERWGGGKYTVQALRRTPTGWKYVTQREVVIAGDPKIEGMFPDRPEGITPLIPTEDSSLSKLAMQTLERQALADRERADRMEREMHENVGKSGLDPALLELIRSSMGGVAEAAQRRADALEREMLRLREEAARPPAPDPLLGRIVEKTIGEDNARMAALRDMHEKEIRAIRENHAAELRSVKDQAREDLKRAEDRADKLIDSMEKQHSREVESLRSTHSHQLESIKAAQEAKHAVLESETRRLIKELEERKIELTELRAKKEKPATELIIELAQMQEAIQALKGEESEQSTFDKIADRVGPIAEAFASRMGQAPPQAPPQAGQYVQQQANPTAAAQAAIVQRTKKQPKPAPKTAVGQQPAAITPEEIKLAVQFIEGAIQADQDPAAFASTIQSSMPGSVVHAIRSAGGVDKFIENNVVLGVNSPLQTQTGKRFIRQVERILLGEATE